MEKHFWIPTRPYTVVDAINRAAAATGSVRGARAASGADFNGHSVSVRFKPHAVNGPIWNAEYHWAGRVVLGRGSFENCLAAALREQARGALGGSVLVTCETEEQAAACLAAGLEAWSKEVEEKCYASFAWWGDSLGDALSWERHGMCPALGFLANSKTREEYKEKVDAFFAERKAAREAL